MTLHGKVEAVTDKGLTVNGEKLEGWMDAMTMSYPVDKPEVLKKVKVGDTIMATVYKGDITLHDVMVMPAGKSDKKK
jgi:Cu/Ag efflux protein CusF